MKRRETELQVYEFQIVLSYMTAKVAEFGMARRYDRLDLADILLDHEVTTIEQLPDVVSLARNLQSGVTSAKAA